MWYETKNNIPPLSIGNIKRGKTKESCLIRNLWNLFFANVRKSKLYFIRKNILLVQSIGSPIIVIWILQMERLYRMKRLIYFWNHLIYLGGRWNLTWSAKKNVKNSNLFWTHFFSINSFALVFFCFFCQKEILLVQPWKTFSSI